MEISRMLPVSDGHQLAVYERGTSVKGTVIFLHGGPGGSIAEGCFSFFDLTKWRVIAFDQRGCGQSLPFASLVENTPHKTVEDIEAIRAAYALDKVVIFGGSYGSTLGLLYGILHPQNVEALVLRGIFLGRREDTQWLFQEGCSYFYPEDHAEFKAFIPENLQNNLIEAYYNIFISDNEPLRKQAAKVWSDWENSIMQLVPDRSIKAREVDDADITMALLECYYFRNGMFWEDDNYLLNNIDPIRDLPVYIVHGRYDVDCRPVGAYTLAQELNNVEFSIIEASGHSPYSEAMHAKLSEIMEKL